MGGRSVPDRGDAPGDEEQTDTADSGPSSSGGSKALPPWMSQRKACRGKKKAKNKKRTVKRTAPDSVPAAALPEAEKGGPWAGAPGRVRTAQRDDGVVARHRLQLNEARNLLSKQGVRLTAHHQHHLGAVFQSPFLWSLPRLAREESDLYVMQDNVLYNAIPWKSAVERIRLAVEFARFRETWKVRELLEEAYDLMEGEDARACDVMAEFRPALKHVLDSSWLLVRDGADVSNRVPFPDGSAEADFVPYSGLGSRQRAAVHGIRAFMCPEELKPAQLARKMDGAEGMWVLVEALCLERAARKSSVVTLPLFERAYALRPNPLTAITLALTLAQHGVDEMCDTSLQKCVELARTCLEKYPQSAYVQLQCARLLHLVPPRFRDLRRSEAAFSSAVHLARDWKKADLMFGRFLLKQGDVELAMKHLVRASAVYEEALGIMGRFPL